MQVQLYYSMKCEHRDMVGVMVALSTHGVR